MKSRWKIALAVSGAGLLLIWILAWWRQDHYDPVNFPPSAQGPWVAFGDSLTAGTGAKRGNDYPAILARDLGVAIENMGVNGQTTAEAMPRVDRALALRPRVVLLCLGGNDGLRRVPAEETFSNLSRIIDRFLAEGTFVVLLGVRSASLTDHFAGEFKRLARDKSVLLVPNVLQGILGHPELMSDYVHPNDRGYELMANRIRETIGPYMEAGNLAPAGF